MSGTPVFKGTRLPVKSLFDHTGSRVQPGCLAKPIPDCQQGTSYQPQLDIARVTRWKDRLMRVLLDEQMPWDFRHYIPGHDVRINLVHGMARQAQR